jgi:hypothetical protein
MTIPDLANALNEASSDFEIGHLQEIRVRLRSLDRAPSRGIFNHQTIHEDWAFHVGGRTELQFNIGKEEHEGGDVIRHGIAFSLELSQTLPTIDRLLPKIARFNDYVRSHPEDFPGLRMWHFRDDVRSEDRSVGPIPDDLIQVRTFIMLGRYVGVDDVDVPAILMDFDRLLPMYTYVESGSHGPSSSEIRGFEPGCPRFAETATAILPARTVDVALRHKAVQSVLYDLLCQEAGKENVRVEYPLDFGARVDAAVRQNGKLIFYEVKIAPTVESCVRAALGQLLEYAHWPSADRASEIVIVGEATLDADGEAYLRLLRERYALPLWYRRIDLDGHVLGGKS